MEELLDSEDFVPRRAGSSKMPSGFRCLIGVTLVVSIAALVLSVAALSLSVFDKNALASSTNPSAGNGIGAIPGRLFPGDDIISGLMAIVRARRLQSAWVAAAVGSLTTYNIRFANQPTGSTGSGHFEIVSLIGTLTSNTETGVTPSNRGGWHLHISVGDGLGRTTSGHLLENSTIYTTLEFVIGYDCNVVFTRAVDGSTPWDELQVAQRQWC